MTTKKTKAKTKSNAAEAAQDFMKLVSGDYPKAKLLDRTVEFRPITLAEMDLWPESDDIPELLGALRTMLNSRIVLNPNRLGNFEVDELREKLDVTTLNQLAVTLRTGRLPVRK